jgi:hypothetical protein
MQITANGSAVIVDDFTLDNTLIIPRVEVVIVVVVMMMAVS